MTGMNRLSPLIVRRAGPLRLSACGGGAGQAVAAALPSCAPGPFAGAEPAQWLEHLKLFATGWIGGLIFFGTLIG